MSYTKPYHKFRDQPNDRIEELFSNYLIDSLSYSKLTTFCRNEKAFEMEYVYCIKSKSSATTVAGTAYHEALRLYFQCYNEGILLDIAALETRAFQVIEEVPANLWKLQKTCPTIEDSVSKACKVSSSLLINFLSEVSVYTSEIKEILGVEEYLDEWLTINGVDIPLPFHMKLDLRFITNEGKRVLADHKSKTAYTDEKELAFSSGKQAITYALGYEMATGETIDEVWIIENKPSKNTDKSPQLRPTKIKLDENTRKLYEAMLYEPTKRVLEAISNPDYVYLINENDNFVDSAELHAFWAQTMIAEVDEFVNIPDNKKDLVSKRLRKIRDAKLSSISPSIIKNFKKYANEFIQYDLSNKDMTNEQKIEHVLRTFGIPVEVQHIFNGYSSSTFLLSIGAGIPITRVQARKLDVANALDVANVRILKDLLVYEGKSYLAVECARKRDRNLMFDPMYISGLKIPIGLDNFQRPVVWDLENQSTPHMIICGATGSGKSVSIISTIEYALLAKVDRIIILDPKYEFRHYASYPNVSVFNDIEDIELEMAVQVEQMNNRIKSGISNGITFIIFDEFADAQAQSRSGNELKVYKNVVVGVNKNGVPKMKREHVDTEKSLAKNLQILAQKGRSCGVRIVAATQRASVEVINGDTKANFPVQLCFLVPKEVDSKVVLDEGGAEGLQGNGDFLFKSPQYLSIVRGQAFYKQ